ncbi:MAG: glycosyltransferase [Rhodothalassiaceae bacterium]
MKIADISEFYSEQGGGVRTYCHQKLEASHAHGVETLIIAPGAEDREERRRGGRIIWVKSPQQPGDKRYHLFSGSQRVHAILDREQPCVVEGSSTWQGGWIAAKWQGPAVKSFFIHQDPVAVYLHTFLGRSVGAERLDRMVGWFWAYLRRLSAHFDTSIVSGQWLADRLSGFGMHGLRSVPLGINKQAFSPAFRSDATRAEMLRACGIDDPGAALLVTVSRHHPEKRLGTLIDAVGQVSRDRSIGLYLIGDGPIRRMIERRAAKVPGVHVAGFLNDRDKLARYLASADAMLHGSAAETYGLVLAEALCAGLPLIVPDAGGARDLAHPAYAELYAAGDLDGCAAAIHRMLGRDRTTASQAALQAAQTRVKRPEEHFNALFNHYQRLINERRPVLAAAE